LKFVYYRGDQQIVMRLHVKWPSELAPDPIGENPSATEVLYGAIGKIPLSQQEFVAGTRVPIDLCEGTPTYDATSGDLTSLSPPSGQDFPDLALGLLGTQYGCVYDQHVTYPDPSPGTERLIQLDQLLYVQGDYTATRR
jgi:hypothetical protein